MSLKQTVKELFDTNSNYLDAQQVLNQANSLKALSDDLYTDPIRFIYELIQNGDDAYHGCSVKNPMIRIAIVDQTYLIVANYGNPLSERDVRGICCVGSGTKKNDPEKTGYKGLGFKAVFGKSNYVLVASKGNFFRFDADAKEFQWNKKWGKDKVTWETLNEQKFEYPWQLCPLWTEPKDIPKSVQQWLFAQPEIVATVMRLKNIYETKEAIQSLMGQPHVFMFLRHIKDIRFSINSATETLLQISILKDGSVKVSYDGDKIKSHWLLHACKLNVPASVLEDTRLPPKLHQDKVVEMTLAAKIDENDRIVQVHSSDSVLFAYLPTKISSYNLPILVNASFLVNASREHILTDSLWNQWLFSCIPKETFHWVQDLTKDVKWCGKAYDLLPNKIPAKDILAMKYNQSCLINMSQVPFLLSIDKKSLSINEAVVDITMLSSTECIGHELIRNFMMDTRLIKTKLARNPFVTNNHRLRNLGIAQFNWEMCMAMLQSNYFLENFSPDRDIKFIQYLFNQQNSTQIQKRLYELPFLMDQNGKLQKVMNIYFPSRFSNADWLLLDSTDAYVHQEIMTWLNNQPSIKQWLRKLGIQEKTDMTFVENYIIPHIHTYINHNNALVTVQRLFMLFQQGLLTTQHLHELRKVKLITVNGDLVPALQLYLPTDYAPYLRLDHLNLDDSLFVSPCYLQAMEGVPTNQLKYFFQSLGVHENIVLMPIDDDWYIELVSAYVCTYTMNLPSYVPFSFKNRITILYLEFTQLDYEFAVVFWEHVIRFINVNNLNESETLFTQRRTPINNLPQWCVRTRNCIPTTTGHLLPSTEVFSMNLRTMIGKYLPVFSCDVRNIFSDGWQKFFGFKTELSIEECFRLLDLIYVQSVNAGFNDDDERCIQAIYGTIITCLAKMDPKHHRRYKIKQPIYLLSTQNNQFMATNQLVFSKNENFTLPPLVAQLRLSLENSSNPQLQLLLDVFNVRQVKIEHLSLQGDINAQSSRSLNTRLRNIQPYVFALADFRKITDHRVDYDFEIFEVDRLELFYEKTIPVCQIPIHVHNNEIYIKRPWKSDETMQILPEALCKQLKLPPEFESDLRLMLMAESTTDIDTYLTQQNIPIHTHEFQDLLSTGGTREKIAPMITRDNIKLFSNLRITDNTSAAEVLLAGLEAQDSKWSDYVYHFTHLENAANILRDHKLKARGQLSTDYFKDSAAENVIKATRANAKNYARFYFRPLTPTQRCNENLGSVDLIERFGNKPMCPVPVFFCFNLRALLNIENLKWKVSLGNMASHHTEFDCTREIVDKFDYQYVYADTRTERGKYSSQHEFLIESELDFNLLTEKDIKLIFQDENALNSLKLMMKHIEYPTKVDSYFFTGYNPRVIIEQSDVHAGKVNVSIMNRLQSIDDGKLIIQVVSKSTPSTITGTLIGIFTRDIGLTILGKDRITFVSKKDDAQYAVYYKYKKQIWLIHTNYADPKYEAPEQDHTYV